MSAPAAAGASGSAAVPPPPPQRKYALVILSHKNGNARSIFIGQESIYVERENGKSYRSYPADADTNKKRLAAAQNDPNFHRVANSRVVLRKLGAASYKYTIQRLSSSSKWGFPKGELLPAETPEEGAMREFFEETGFHLQEDKLIHARNIEIDARKYHVFYYKADDDEKRGIQEAYAEKVANREGELFNGDFFTVPEIIDLEVPGGATNRISSVAFQYYLSDIIDTLTQGLPLVYGGAKKRRSTKRNKNKKRKLTRRK
jgi:8-oxo-dGTP pyrophosphatase MutT (NUDIX family)